MEKFTFEIRVGGRKIQNTKKAMLMGDAEEGGFYVDLEIKLIFRK